MSSGERKASLEGPAVDRVNRLGRDMSTATLLFHQAVADRLGLNPTDHKGLGFLQERGSMTAGQLADLTGLTTGAVTGIVDRLERAGFVRRARDPHDRRRVIVQLIPAKAEREVMPLFEPLGRAVTALVQSYSERDRAVIDDFMARSIALMHEQTARVRAQPASTKRRRP